MSTKRSPTLTKTQIAFAGIDRQMSTLTDGERERIRKYHAKLRRGERLTKKEISDLQQVNNKHSLEEKIRFHAVPQTP